jgi:pyruvate-ferredoxin/flavodoxin oxidoreductase
MVKIRLFRPVLGEAFPGKPCPRRSSKSPCSTSTKEPGGAGRTALSGRADGLAEGHEQGRLPTSAMPRVIGGRYGLSSKEFTPAMIKAVLDDLKAGQAQEPLHRRHH